MEVIQYVHVVGKNGTLLGVVDLRELLAADPEQTLGDIMRENVIAPNADKTLSNAVDMFKRYSFRAIRSRTADYGSSASFPAMTSRASSRALTRHAFRHTARLPIRMTTPIGNCSRRASR